MPIIRAQALLIKKATRAKLSAEKLEDEPKKTLEEVSKESDLELTVEDELKKAISEDPTEAKHKEKAESAPVEKSSNPQNPDSADYVDMSSAFVAPPDEDAFPGIMPTDLDSEQLEELEPALEDKTPIKASMLGFTPAIPLGCEDDFSVADREEVEEDYEEENTGIYDVLIAYLKVVNSPTDEQFHMLAQALGMSPEALEAEVYKLTSILLEDQELTPDSREAIRENLG
jgi:hypothetical protein